MRWYKFYHSLFEGIQDPGDDIGTANDIELNVGGEKIPKKINK